MAADTTGGSRDRSLDVAKGLAITAIVVSHVLRSIAAPETLPRISEPFLEIDDGLYSWHIVVFALVSGVLAPNAVEKHGRWAYARSRVTLFTYLYVVWTVIQAGLKQVEAAAAGDGFDTRGFLQSFLTAYGQLWWLAFMVLATVLVVLVRPWRSRTAAASSLVTVGALSIALWGWTGPWVFEEGLALLVFYWIGALAGREGMTLLTGSRATSWIAGAALALGLGLLVVGDPVPPTSYLGTRMALGITLGILASTALSLGAVALSGRLARTSLVGVFGFLGQRSLEIFLAHLLAITGARSALEWLGVEHLGITIVVGTAAGIAAPLGLWWLGRRAHFPWLFESPLK